MPPEAEGDRTRRANGAPELSQRAEDKPRRWRRVAVVSSGLRDRFHWLRRGPAGSSKPRAAKARWRSWAKWVAIACAGWIALSFAAFEVSAAIQSTKLDSGVASIVGGGPFMFASAQTILVVGTDARPPGTREPGGAITQKCYGEQATGARPSGGCAGYDADTLMLIRAGGGTFRKLSIPRDSYADIPGHAPQKLDAAYELGGAKLEVRAVEGFLGIHIDHILIVDFKSFENFIDAIGGVSVFVPERICSKISGGFANGGYTLNLSRGRHLMDGAEALAYARTRKNTCDRTYTDLRRERAQQGVISGVKARLIDPLRLPYNFIRGPIIGWDAPRAFVSDVGAWTMPQVLLSAALGGGTPADGLCQKASARCDLGYAPNYYVTVPLKERRRAVWKLLHG